MHPEQVPRNHLKSGSASTPTAMSVQSQGEPGRIVQPKASITRSAGGTRLRRRLSRSFQRSRTGSGLRVLASGRRHTSAQPGQELPVAPDPAMLSAGIGVVPGGKVVEELRVAEQPAAGVVALDQVVAENVIFGKCFARGRLEGIDLVDSLAGEAAQPKEIHIGIGRGARVRVDAPRCRQEPGEP